MRSLRSEASVSRPKAHRVTAPVLDGHKGPAIVWPFDPATVFGARPRQFVEGTMNGVAFVGEIGFRRRVHYTCVPEGLLEAAGVAPGAAAEFVVSAREPTTEDLATPSNLVWARLVATGTPTARRRSDTTRKPTRGSRDARPPN
jgi:hypothetical protein